MYISLSKILQVHIHHWENIQQGILKLQNFSRISGNVYNKKLWVQLHHWEYALLIFKCILCQIKIKQQAELTFIESVTDFGRNRLKPISFSKYSKLDFLSKATCGMSLKNRLKSYKTNMKPWFIVVYLAVHVPVTITLLDNTTKIHLLWTYNKC